MTSHPTYTDKGRPARLTADNKWHALLIKDGTIKKSLTPPPGIYLVQYQFLGRALDRHDIDIRIERYPIDGTDNGTAWHTIVTRPGTWFESRGGFRVTVHADGTYSTSIGITYRVPKVGAKISLSQRIIKFTKQID